MTRACRPGQTADETEHHPRANPEENLKRKIQESKRSLMQKGIELEGRARKKICVVFVSAFAIAGGEGFE